MLTLALLNLALRLPVRSIAIRNSANYSSGIARHGKKSTPPARTHPRAMQFIFLNKSQTHNEIKQTVSLHFAILQMPIHEACVTRNSTELSGAKEMRQKSQCYTGYVKSPGLYGSCKFFYRLSTFLTIFLIFRFILVKIKLVSLIARKFLISETTCMYIKHQIGRREWKRARALGVCEFLTFPISIPRTHVR